MGWVCRLNPLQLLNPMIPWRCMCGILFLRAGSSSDRRMKRNGMITGGWRRRRASGRNGASRRGSRTYVLSPTGVEFWKTGPDLDFTPQVNSNGTITITLSVAYEKIIAWRTNQFTAVSDGKELGTMSLGLPVSESFSVQTSLTVPNGEEVLVSGGALGETEGSSVYCLIRASTSGGRSNNGEARTTESTVPSGARARTPQVP